MKVDDDNWVNCKRVKGPLYVVRWNSKEYLEGLHKIEVSCNKSYLNIFVVQLKNLIKPNNKFYF